MTDGGSRPATFRQTIAKQRNYHRGPLTCVTYHYFGPSSDATRLLGIATRLEFFFKQLDYFNEHYNVISLDTLLSADIPDNALLITIDDAYRSVLQFAAPALKARRMPAVFFANPKPIAEPFVPLDNLLSLACSRLGADELYRLVTMKTSSYPPPLALLQRHIAQLSLPALSTVKTRVLARLACTEAELHRDMNIFLNTADLRRLQDYGIEIANHTMTHTRCGVLNEGELYTEISEAKQLLEMMTGVPVRGFAFPWGHKRDATAAVLREVRQSGHTATFLMHGRLNTWKRPAADIWFRVNITNQNGWRQLHAALKVYPWLRSLQ